MSIFLFSLNFTHIFSDFGAQPAQNALAFAQRAPRKNERRRRKFRLSKCRVRRRKSAPVASAEVQQSSTSFFKA